MPREIPDLRPFTAGAPTFASGNPFNDLEYTILDTDYIDGENSGGDVFLPVDPADPLPGEDKVKYIRCVLNLDLDAAYGSGKTDRIILGTDEISRPFFLRGEDGIDNDYAVIQHLDFNTGYIQLKGQPEDYDLVYCTRSDGCATEGWYLFYTANDEADLIAFIYPCWDLQPAVSGEPFNVQNPICNGDSVLELNNPNHFRYAEPINTSVAIQEGIVQYGSAGKENVGGLTVDTEGNIYFYGSTDGNLDGGIDGNNELFVAKVDPQGNELWATEIPAAEGTMLKDGAVDRSHIYLCGRTLGSLQGFNNAGSWDGILLKLDKRTGRIVETNQWGNAGIDGYGNIAFDDDGNFFVSGQGSPQGQGGTDDVYLVAKHRKSDLSNVWRALNTPNAPGFKASAEAWGGLSYRKGSQPGDGALVAGGWYFGPTGANAFVSVYEDLNESSPTRVHSAVINSPGTRAEWVFDNAFDREGNIYVAGATTGNLGAAPRGKGDAYIMRMSSDLQTLDALQFGTPECDVARKIFVKDDTLYVLGFTYGALAGDNADNDLETADVFLYKLDASLNVVSAIQFGTPREERAFGEILGDVLYVGGLTEGAMSGSNKGSFDAFAVAVDLKDLNFVQPAPTFISEQKQEDLILVSPNPVYRDLAIKSNLIRSIDAKIVSIDGKVVWNGQLPANTTLVVSTEDWQSGVYLLHAEGLVKRLVLLR